MKTETKTSGWRVMVSDDNCKLRGFGEVVDTSSPGYIGVRFDGESGVYEWPEMWCFEVPAVK